MEPLVTSMTKDEQAAAVDLIRGARKNIAAELGKVIIGQEQVIEEILIVLLSGGHALMTGAPGLAKTLLVKSLGDLFDLEFSRVQFTPDLMPSDIIGTEVLQETANGRTLQFQQGPIFANLILADEINRTPPKTQAALLEAMQEKQVTAAGATRPLPQPFFVLATQNPIEMEGTYALPEAQLDRFMLNVVVDYLPKKDEVAVVEQTTGTTIPELKKLYNADQLLQCHKVVRTVPIARELVEYAVDIVSASRPNQEHTPAFINEMVQWGAGLRGAQNLVLGAKTRALLSGRTYVEKEDIDKLAHSTLRHRILPNYKAEAEGRSVSSIIEELLSSVKM